MAYGYKRKGGRFTFTRRYGRKRIRLAGPPKKPSGRLYVKRLRGAARRKLNLKFSKRRGRGIAKVKQGRMRHFSYYGKYRYVDVPNNPQILYPMLYPGIGGNNDWNPTTKQLGIKLRDNLPPEYLENIKQTYEQVKVKSYTIMLRQKTKASYTPEMNLRYQKFLSNASGSSIVATAQPGGDSSQVYDAVIPPGVQGDPISTLYDGRDIAVNKLVHALYVDMDGQYSTSGGGISLEKLRNGQMTKVKYAVAPRGLSLTVEGNQYMEISDQIVDGTGTTFKTTEKMALLKPDQCFDVQQRPIEWWMEPCPGARNGDQLYFWEVWIRVNFVGRCAHRRDDTFGSRTTSIGNILGNYLPPPIAKPSWGAQVNSGFYDTSTSSGAGSGVLHYMTDGVNG